MDGMVKEPKLPWALAVAAKVASANAIEMMAAMIGD